MGTEEVSSSESEEEPAAKKKKEYWGSGRRDWKITFLGVPGRYTVVSPKRGVHVCAVEALYPPGLAWRRWRWLVDEGKEKGWD